VFSIFAAAIGLLGCLIPTRYIFTYLVDVKIVIIICISIYSVVDVKIVIVTLYGLILLLLHPIIISTQINNNELHNGIERYYTM
jgi:hypothetical protein